MPLRSHTGRNRSLAYSELASQPLPGPAVVIDVRKTTSYDPPLAWHITAELEDLTTQMRLHGVKRWRFLSDCIEFITLDPLPPDRTVHTATQFTLIRGNGDIQSFSTNDGLINYLHKEYVDLVRTNRISAARDADQSIASSRMPEVELERSTVRVFFLADMADPASLTHAAHYAALLRKKSEEYDNVLRSGREERINPIIICMNADRLHSRQSPARSHPNTVVESQQIVLMHDETRTVSANQSEAFFSLPTSSQYKDLLPPLISNTFDMVILLYAYRDDEGFVGSDAQIYELELLLYTLLLVPESLATWGQEMRDGHAEQYLLSGDLHEEAPTSPRCEVCMLGIASLEYSASWGQRWLDYGLVKKMLQTLRETETIEDERNLRLPDGRDWLESWWTNVRSVLPHMLIDVIPGTKGLSEFQRTATSSPFQGVPLRDSLHVLHDFCQSLGNHYTGDQGATLQKASQSVEQVGFLLKETYRKGRKNNFRSSEAGGEALKELQELQGQANLFSVSLFKNAAGALPRAISQLSELESRIEEGDIGRYAQHAPNFSRLQEHFEEQAHKAQHYLVAALNVWQLPVIGRVLRSTLLSLSLVVFIALVVWFLQDSLAFLPGILTRSLPEPAGISIFRLLVIVVLGLAEFLYLFRRDRRLREQRNSILQALCQTAIVHLTEVQTIIAAGIALRLLQEAGLYQPKGKAGPYKQRLRAIDKVLKEAQEQALLHHRSAYDRLKLGLSPIQTGMLSTSAWLNLNTRKDLLPWEQTIEVFQRLEKELVQNNRYLDMLAESLLRQLATELPNAAPASVVTPDGQTLTVQEQLLTISSELVATLLVAEVTGSNIPTLHPLLERYLSLEQRDQYVPSLLGESIAELYNAVRAMKLEQAMNNDLDISSQLGAFENFITKAKKPVEEMLATWIENFCDMDEQSKGLLSSGNIIEHLQASQIKLFDALEDLRRRCKLLGYRDELVDGSDAFMLLVPGAASNELQDALANLQPNQLRLLRFPDEEKLVYLHTYRVEIKSEPVS